MLAAMGAVAWAVYKKLGLAILKKGWVNFDLIWAGACSWSADWRCSAQCHKFLVKTGKYTTLSG
jgi:hypothetical protein